MAAVAEMPSAVSPVGERRVRVLVVDDVASLRDLLRTVLEIEDDFVVVGEAGDGAEALRTAAMVRPDLVLLDIAMPVMDGLEALPRLRALLPSAKIVMFSGFETEVAVEQVIDGGADAYVEKGMPVPELVAQIRSVAHS
jgi:DNA-binding NarL/FixJ family response regulator